MTVLLTEIEASGFQFRARSAGDDGEPVVLLHGFPETSHMWVGLMERLAAAGYRCVAPDQRGYSPGARPDGADQYGYRSIGSDVLAIAEAAGFDRFHLVGHDWGAVAGWAALELDATRIQSWTALSVPHVAAFGGAIANDPDQQQRSQYIGRFQQVGTAEEALSGNDFQALRGLWSLSSAEQVEDYLSVFRQPGALTAALNWYRAGGGIRAEAGGVSFGPVTVPTLMLWGNQDMAIGRVANENAAAFMSGPYRFVELDAGHWLIQQEPDRVIEEILAHVKANPFAS